MENATKSIRVSEGAWRRLKQRALDAGRTVLAELDAVLDLADVPSARLAAASAVLGQEVLARPVVPIPPPVYLCGHCPGEHPIGMPCPTYPDRPAKTRLVRHPETGEWNLDPAAELVPALDVPKTTGRPVAVPNRPKGPAAPAKSAAAALRAAIPGLTTAAQLVKSDPDDVGGDDDA